MKYLSVVILLLFANDLFPQNFIGVKHHNFLYLKSADSLNTSFLSANSLSFEFKIKSEKANQIISAETQYIGLYDTFRFPIYYLAGIPIVNNIGDFRFGAGLIPTFGKEFTMLATGEMSIALNVIDERGICILGLRNSRDLRLFNNLDRFNISSSVFGGIMINLNTINKRIKK